MNKKDIIKVLENLKAKSKKRNFAQTYDLIINLRNLDTKKPEGQIDFYAALPNSKTKPVKICALVGPETKQQAEEACGAFILSDDFESYKDKKKAKELANNYDYFIAQGNMMGQIAAVFGRVFGPKGKMPNPKAGCVVPPKTNLKPLADKLRKTVKISSQKSLNIQVAVGSEDMPDEKVAENLVSIYDQITHHLPQEKHNLKSVLLKLTMSKPEKLTL